jgi:hypothetical protein
MVTWDQGNQPRQVLNYAEGEDDGDEPAEEGSDTDSGLPPWLEE